MDNTGIKRRLSPSTSSRSSPTPVPHAFPSNPLTIPSNPASPAEFGANDDAASLSVPGPSRASHTPTPFSAPSRDEQTSAKAATLVVGSGDGTQYGDECFLWTDLPMNKGGFRYLPCRPSPNPSPSPLYPFYRTLPGPSSSPLVHISWLDRSSFLRVSVDGLTASTDRGYRSGRANVSVREGSWYYEVKVERGNKDQGVGGGIGGDAGNAHVRIGWGRREANLDAPVGLDAYSYGIRDTNGEKIHLSRPKGYGKGFGTGDIVGCLLRLPPRPVVNKDESDPASIKRKRIPILYKGQRYFEMDEYPVAKEMEALVDREGKGEAAAKAAALAEVVGKENDAKENRGGGKAGVKDKKGATTKNAKKGKPANGVSTTPSGPVVRPLKTLTGSSIAFYLNGEPLGEAFSDLYDFVPLPPIASVIVPGPKRAHGHHLEPGKDVQHDDGTLGYFPMISCFARGKVRCNFGPDFTYSPRSLGLSEDVRAVCERWDEFREEERILDEIHEEIEGERIRKEMKDDEIRKKAIESRLGVVNGARGTPGKRGKKITGSAAKRKRTIDEPNGGTPIPDVGTPLSNDISTPPFDERNIPAQDVEDSTTIKVEIGQYEVQPSMTPASPTALPGLERANATMESSMPPSDGGELEEMEVDDLADKREETDRMEMEIEVEDNVARDSESEEEEQVEW